MDRDRLTAHAQELGRALADVGNALVRTVVALQPEEATQGIAARIASGESPALTLRWLEDRIELRVGLDGADDSPALALLALDFARLNGGGNA